MGVEQRWQVYQLEEVCNSHVLRSTVAPRVDFHREKNKVEKKLLNQLDLHLWPLHPSSSSTSSSSSPPLSTRSAWRLPPALSLISWERAHTRVSASLWGLPFILWDVLTWFGTNLEPHCTSWGHTPKSILETHLHENNDSLWVQTNTFTTRHTHSAVFSIILSIAIKMIQGLEAESWNWK